MKLKKLLGVWIIKKFVERSDFHLTELEKGVKGY